jgi:flagellar protein FliO/FliZ
MTWMIIRLILSLAFVGGVLWFAARLAKKRGLGQGNGLIEVVARQRMGRTSTVNVVRIADVVLVIGATEEQVTLLAEVDPQAVDTALAERRPPARLHAAPTGETTPGTAAAGTVVVPAPRPSTGALAGSVFDRNGWRTFVHSLRERTVRRS